MSPELSTTTKSGPVPSAPALGHILLERELITPDQLTAAIEHQRKRPDRRLGEVLIDLSYTTPDAVLGALSVQLGVAATRLNDFTVSPGAIQAVPEWLARKHRVVPLQKIGTILQVAIARPNDLAALDDLRFASGCQIQMFVALEDEIAASLDRFYAAGTIDATVDENAPPVVINTVQLDRLDRSRDPERRDRRAVRGRRKTDQEPPDDVFDEVTEQTAVHTVDRILSRAAEAGASDLHLERTPHNLRVRFRVDGTFRDVGYVSTSVAPAICARLKVLGGMDIAEHRLPQDGRLSVTIGTRRLTFRASTFPTIHGEKVVLRMLDQGALRLELTTLGLGGPLLEQFREIIHKPEGLVLITGPTGSGKTSTLYAALDEIVQTGKNITTIENPVEYELIGTNQGQINEKAGFTFARGLRALLRQDPDVIMVGEIRDRETLTTSIEASLTGHLVFSTLHTSSAVGTITRLMDMGIEPYFLAASIQAIIGQRLVRRICSQCAADLPVPAGVHHLFGADVPQSLRHGKGCTECRGTGFAGRIGIYEMMRMTHEVRELILARASERALVEAARRNQMTTLREECIARVREGLTTLEEVVRVTQ